MAFSVRPSSHREGRVTNSIHTVNARGNIFLEVMRDHFDLSPAIMHREIQGMRNQVVRSLEAKGIAYDDLKPALVPDRKRKEIALIFDSSKIASGWYGLEVWKQYMPLFEMQSKHSVLEGDYIGGSQDRLYEAMVETVQFVKPTEWVYSNQYHIVYINNLSPAMFEQFASALIDYPPYVGYADTSYASPFKWVLAGTLCHVFIKHGKLIIQGHEDDRVDAEDVNMIGYPFEDLGYECRSIMGTYEGVLLSYKIERPVIPGFETDTEFSLNAVTATPSTLDGFEVEVEEAKMGYLKSAKSGSIEKARLSDVSSAELAKLIGSKIAGSYLYNLSFEAEHNTTKFNVIIELPFEDADPVRLLAALEYKPDDRKLRLITLY